MTNEIPPELERFIHKLHLRTYEKIMPHVKEQFPDVTPNKSNTSSNHLSKILAI